MGFVIIGVLAILGISITINMVKEYRKKEDEIVFCKLFFIIPFLFAAVIMTPLTFDNINKVYELEQDCHESYSNISVNAANMLKAADTILTFTDKSTNTYQEIMVSIADARGSNYSPSSITHLVNVIHENYPTDMEMGKLWQKYVNEVDTAYTTILDAQVGYNKCVKEYKSKFSPTNRFFLMFLIEEDTSIDYYKIDFNIDYTIKNN